MADTYLNQLKTKATPATTDYMIGVETGEGATGGGGFRTPASQYAKASDLSDATSQLTSSINDISGNNTDWIYLHNESGVRTVKYKLQNGTVFVWYSLTNFDNSPGNYLFRMPEGFRPSEGMIISATAVNQSGGSSGTWQGYGISLQIVGTNDSPAGTVQYITGLPQSITVNGFYGAFSYPV